MGKGAKNKAFIQHQDTGDIMEFVYNPESWNYSYGSEYARIKAPGSSHPLYQFVGGNERTLTVELLIDGREAHSGGWQKVQQQMYFLGRWHPANKSYDGYHPPSKALFAMGWFSQTVMITEIDYTAELFDEQLRPIRVRANLTMETVIPDKPRYKGPGYV